MVPLSVFVCVKHTVLPREMGISLVDLYLKPGKRYMMVDGSLALTFHHCRGTLSPLKEPICTSLP